MPSDWFLVLFGGLFGLVGFAQAWRPDEAARVNDRFMPKMVRPDWTQELWLVRLVGVIVCLAGFGILIAGL